MKKKLFFCICILCSTISSRAQFIQINDVKAAINNNGILFNFSNTQTAGYEVPNASGLTAIYAASLWCSGLDANGITHLAAMRYGQSGNDFFPGPYSSTNAYSNSSYTSSYGNSIWSVSKVDILTHIANYNLPNYVVPTAISTWPGNGISGLGIAQNLAPYVDLNNNGIYEPNLGDYPDVRGDLAYYIIMNDSKANHTETGGVKMGIEVHTMVYQILSNDYLHRTTFVNYKVFNRGNTDYSNFKLGMWWDPDLGNPFDDYIGCDTLQNVMYVYNADNTDENGSSYMGYGTNPPALGIRALSNSMTNFTFFSNGALFPTNDPVSAAGYSNIMNGYWADGSVKYYGGNGSFGSIGSTTQTTEFLFSGNPNNIAEWSETSVNGSGISNPPGDRRGVMTLEAENLPPGAFTCYDFAVLYAREPGNNNFQNVNALLSLAATAKTDFDAMTNYNCNLYTADVEQLDENQIAVFPNPSNGFFNLSFGENVSGEIQITDMAGRLVYHQIISNQTSAIVRLQEVSGIYHLTILLDKGTVHKKISIQK